MRTLAPSVEFFAKLVPDEASDGNFLPHLGGDLVDQLRNGLRIVLHVVLLQQDVLLEELPLLALDDHRDLVLGLTLLAQLYLPDPSLGVEHVMGSLLAR